MRACARSRSASSGPSLARLAVISAKCSSRGDLPSDTAGASASPRSRRSSNLCPGVLHVGWVRHYRVAVAARMSRRRHRINAGRSGPCTRHACAEQHGGDDQENDHGANSSRPHSDLPRALCLLLDDSASLETSHTARRSSFKVFGRTVCVRWSSIAARLSIAATRAAWSRRQT